MNQAFDRDADIARAVGADADDAWLETLLQDAAADAEALDLGFSAALLERLPPPALPRGLALPLWFRTLNGMALTLGCALTGWWLWRILPGVLDMTLPGVTLREGTSGSTLLAGVLLLITLAGWLYWWSRATLNDLLWSTLSELK